MGLSRGDIAYQYIAKQLTSGELKVGQKLSEQAIASACGISRTPVREAIQRLTGEGILYQIPSSGTYVAMPQRGQIVDAFEIRLVVESFAVKRAIYKLTREQRAELRQNCEIMHSVAVGLQKKKKSLLIGSELVKFLKADLSFHLIILKAAGNNLALEIVTSAYQRNQFFGQYSHERNLHHVAWAWRQHAVIERAIRRGDMDEALTRVEHHIQWSMHDALKAFDKRTALDARHNRNQSDPVDKALTELSLKFK